MEETRIMVLHLFEVSSCSVPTNLRNDVLDFAVFTTVLEFKIGFSGVNKHSVCLQGMATPVSLACSFTAPDCLE